MLTPICCVHNGKVFSESKLHNHRINVVFLFAVLRATLFSSVPCNGRLNRVLINGAGSAGFLGDIDIEKGDSFLCNLISLLISSPSPNIQSYMVSLPKTLRLPSRQT